MKFLIFLFLLPLNVFAQEPPTDPDIAKKIESIKNYSPLLGEWEGKFKIENAPEELLKIMAKGGNDNAEVGIKITLKENSSEVYFKFSSKIEWEKSDAEIQVAMDRLGWHMHLIRAEDIWLERIFISVARLREDMGQLTITRTVHNWFHTEKSDFPEYYFTFGNGELKKI